METNEVLNVDRLRILAKAKAAEVEADSMTAILPAT